MSRSGEAPTAAGSITLTAEAVLRGTLKSLDRWKDDVTGEVLPRTGRDRVLFELTALLAYAEGQGVDLRDLPATAALRSALGDAQRGVAHPMLTPAERPKALRLSRDKNGKPIEVLSARSGPAPLGLPTVWLQADASAATSVLYFHGWRPEKAAAVRVVKELARHGLGRAMTPAQIRRVRAEIACGVHERAVCDGRPTVWTADAPPAGGDASRWISSPPEPPAGPRALPPTETVRQRHYDSLWPVAEWLVQQLVAVGMSERDAAELAIERVLGERLALAGIAPLPALALSNRAQEIWRRNRDDVLAEWRRRNADPAEKSR